jgi:membrane protease YdiL (CAAX protease family)
VILGALLTVPGTVLVVLAAIRRPGLLASPAELGAAVQSLALTFGGLTTVIAVNAVLLVGVCGAAAALSPLPARARLGLGRPRLGAGGIAFCVLGALACSQALDGLVDLCGLGEVGFLARFRDLAAHLPAARLVVLALIMGALPGFGEELFFRGYMQTRLAARWGAARAIVVSGLLFGLLHLDPVQSPLAACLGLYLGLVAVRAGSIWPAIIAHTVNNVVAVLTAALVPGPTGRPLGIALFIGGAAVGGAVLVWLRRTPAGAPAAQEDAHAV